MSSPLNRDGEAQLSSPLDSQPADPTKLMLPSDWGTRRRVIRDPATTKIATEHSAFRGRQVADSAEVARVEEARSAHADRLARADLLVQQSPTAEIAWARRAQALAGEGRVDDAVTSAERALELSAARDPAANWMPERRTAQFIAARILAAAGDIEAAEQALSVIPGKGPWRLLYATLALSRGGAEKALERLGDAESAEALAFRGFLNILLKNYSQAIRDLRQVQRSGNDSPALLMNLAYCLAASGSIRKALRAAKQAVALAPRSRHASFNLISYHLLTGQHSDALAEVQRIAGAVTDKDGLIAAAEADVYLAINELRKALQALRRARHHSEVDARSSRGAELDCNIALLEWRIGSKDKAHVLRTVRKHVLESEPSLSVGLMFAALLKNAALVTELRRYHSSLLERFPPEVVAPLTAELLLLDGAFAEAAACVLDYAIANPLDIRAVRNAIFVYGTITGDFERSAEIGMSALRLAPRDEQLRNNVAYVLVLSGRPAEAEAILRSVDLDTPYLIATRGLVEFGLGNIDAGLDFYDQALANGRAEFADADEFVEFESLLRLHEALALRELGLWHSVQRVRIELSASPLPGWRVRSAYLPLYAAARRLAGGTASEELQWFGADSDSLK